MKMTEFFGAQLEREGKISRRTLQNVPEGRPDWKPHEKSMALGVLANLVASMPVWIDLAINQDELDLNPPGGKKFKTPDTPTTSDLLKAHDDSVAKAQQALKDATDDFLQTPWKLLVAGKVVDESPRYQVITDVFTHLAHHRGQLTVYLRLNDAKVASLYGPTADDKSFG